MFFCNFITKGIIDTFHTISRLHKLIYAKMIKQLILMLCSVNWPLAVQGPQCCAYAARIKNL